VSIATRSSTPTVESGILAADNAISVERAIVFV
jgi:hypothetical protein